MANRSHKTFKPLLCRFSQNDAVRPTKLSGSSSGDPSSPTLTCIGQMKKKPTTTTTATTTTTTATATTANRFLSGSLLASVNAKSSGHSNRYKLFSVKNLISPAIDTATIKQSNSKFVTNRSKSCNGRGRTAVRSKKCYMNSSDDHDVLRVVVAEELDPPLPVVKCRRRDEDVNVDLWKRRGFEMKTIQIQPIQVSMNQNTCSSYGGFSVPTSATIF